jgi:hypothetical protein
MHKIFKALALITIVGFVSTKHSAHKDADAYPSVAQQNSACKISCMKKVNFCQGITTEACSQKFSSCMANCQNADDLTKAVESSYLINVQAKNRSKKSSDSDDDNSDDDRSNDDRSDNDRSDDDNSDDDRSDDDRSDDDRSDDDNSDDDQDKRIIHRRDRSIGRVRDLMRRRRDSSNDNDRDVMRGKKRSESLDSDQDDMRNKKRSDSLDSDQ